MAASSKKRYRKGSSKSPKKTRKRMAKTTAADFNNEDYNIRSPERTQLLTQLKDAIGGIPVSPTFWACCHLADMNRLNLLQQSLRIDPEAIVMFDKPSAFLPLLWTQRFRDSELTGSERVSPQRSEGPKKRKLNADGQSWVQRSAKEADKYKERDNYACLLTDQLYPQAAHIFPYSMLNSRPITSKTRTSNCMPEFWQMLRLFWDKDRVNNWIERIFSDPQNPNTGVGRCFNLISFNADVHVKWNRGLFALKPLELSSDRKQLTVQFFWQVPGKYDVESRVDLLTKPTSSKGLDGLEDGKCSLSRHGHLICSGEVFTLTTEDPEELPLPSIGLLEMQWVLQRLVGMSGAAGWPALDLDDDESGDNGWYIQDHTSNMDDTLKRVCDWVSAGKAVDITPEFSTPTPCPSVIPCH